MKTLALLLFSAVAYSQPLRTAQVAYLTASTADIISSRGLIEMNPILGAGQPFGQQQALRSAAISASAVLASEVVVRKWPKMRKTMAIAMFVMAGTRGAVAVRNTRIR